MQLPENLKKLVATVRRLADTDPQAEAVARTVEGMREQISQLTSEVEKPAGASGSFGEESRKQDVNFMKEQISKLQKAAYNPAKNYTRIYNLLGELGRAAEISGRPQYAAVRPQIASVVEKLSGLFKDVDTTADLDKPLQAIEDAVHKMYGDQSKNGTFYLDRRGKGHAKSE